MAFLGEKTVAPTPEAHFCSNIEEEKQCGYPDDTYPEGCKQNIALSLCFYPASCCCPPVFEGQYKSGQQQQAHRYPYDVDTVPTQTDGQDSRGNDRTEQSACPIEGMKIIEQGRIARKTCDICIETCVQGGNPEAQGEQDEQQDEE